MSKTLKKILITSASLFMFASIGTSVNSLSNNGNAHAESLLKQYEKSEPQDARWHNTPGAGQNQANFGFNKK